MADDVVRDDAREDREQHQDDDDHAPDERSAVLPEADPEDLTRASPLDRRRDSCPPRRRPQLHSKLVEPPHQKVPRCYPSPVSPPPSRRVAPYAYMHPRATIRPGEVTILERGTLPSHPGYGHRRGREDLGADRDRRRARVAGRAVCARRPRLAGLAAAGSRSRRDRPSVLVENLRHVSATFRRAGVERLVLARAVRAGGRARRDPRSRSAPVTSSVVRLVASPPSIERRLRGRDAGAQLAEHLAESARSRPRPRQRASATPSSRRTSVDASAVARAVLERAAGWSQGAPDERRGRRHRDEAEALEDRPAVVRRVHLQVGEPACGREVRAVGDERAVDPAAAPAGSVPPPHSVAKPLPLDEAHPAGADDRARRPRRRRSRARRDRPRARPRGCRRASRGRRPRSPTPGRRCARGRPARAPRAASRRRAARGSPIAASTGAITTVSVSSGSKPGGLAAARRGRPARRARGASTRTARRARRTPGSDARSASSSVVTLDAGEIAVADRPAVREAGEAPERAVALDATPSREPALDIDAELVVVRERGARLDRERPRGTYTSSRAPARTTARRASLRSPRSSPSISAGSGASQRITASSTSWR